MERRALVLLSGGLDSILATALLKRLNFEVIGISFITPFFGSAKAEKAANTLGIELIVEDIGEPHLKMLKNPRYGYGKNMNPCIDCHALMISQAALKLEEVNGDFIATGEVLGERPKSQNRQALEIVASLSGADDLLLRPLSGRLLPPTRPEMLGLVRREELLDMRGRSRRRQIQLAEEWGISDYESPAGGCLLTDANISLRLKQLMQVDPDFDIRDARLATVGRQLWTGKTLIVLGRNHDDNERLQYISLPSDLLMREDDVPGPLALLRTYPRGDPPDNTARQEAARMLGIYGKGKKALRLDQTIEVLLQTPETG
ncbi:MAG: hypothetical protein A2W01_12060 [Candidatus Solincola sediminis]|nr:MAG: hypothetical protein A2W01_12060 [Candidatus Solincola sediminis]